MSKVLDKLQFWPDDGTRGNIKRSLKSLGFIFWAPWMCVQNVMVIHPIVVEVFQFGPKWWTCCTLCTCELVVLTLQFGTFWMFGPSLVCYGFSNKHKLNRKWATPSHQYKQASMRAWMQQVNQATSWPGIGRYGMQFATIGISRGFCFWLE